MESISRGNAQEPMKLLSGQGVPTVKGSPLAFEEMCLTEGPGDEKGSNETSMKGEMRK